MIYVKSLLSQTGIPSRKTKFVSPPKSSSYIVWFDSRSNIGPDMKPSMLRKHDISIELYEYKPDETAEAALEAVLDKEDIEWECGDRNWIEKEQLYQVVYTFNFIEKRS